MIGSSGSGTGEASTAPPPPAYDSEVWRLLDLRRRFSTVNPFLKDVILALPVCFLCCRSRRGSMEALRERSSAVDGGGDIAGAFPGDTSLDSSGDGGMIRDLATRIPRC
ncbi:hypothetical protein DY000_02027941 [Brassica cretica]|uniref:Uncharacterized protein n=1 Tax=Brassica cretica TaxID=69181 RepID=A0ABQ7EJ24_BRACR|nr:hypothetical protein DY000_02027941 [Brassica cretica]